MVANFKICKKKIMEFSVMNSFSIILCMDGRYINLFATEFMNFHCFVWIMVFAGLNWMSLWNPRVLQAQVFLSLQQV